jgi:pyruvate dehydrogenase E2 component (dihydrolipoamide acetyltransferase)
MIEIVMPKLGLTMEEGTILRWLQEEGDVFDQGEPLVEIESDKAAVEVESPSYGVLGKVLVDAGTVVSVGQVIAYLLEPGEDQPQTWPVLEDLAKSEEVQQNHKEAGVGTTFTKTNMQKSGRAPASPIARKLAREKEVDLSQVEGSGPGGRITEKDVLSFIKGETETPNEDSYLPNRLKRITGERLSSSFKESPHFYLGLEANASSLMTLRKKLLPDVEEKTGIRHTYTDLFLFILAKSISSHPYINSHWDNGKIRRNPDINIGLAVAVDDGLIVPIIKFAHQLTFNELVVERERLTKKAFSGNLTPQELEGGTFTLTNLGMLGVDEFSAILNPPQAAILAVGRIAKRAVVEGDNVVARPTVRLTLSVDHRVVDGAEGARFLKDFVAHIECIEDHFISE